MRRRKVIILSISLVLFLAVLSFVLIPIITKSKIFSQITGKNTASDISVPSKSLNYEFVTTKTIPEKYVRYIYFTTETTDKNLVAINDQIIASLKNSGKITNMTSVYYIDYFNDKEVAKTYFDQIGDKNTAQSERLRLISNYVASMNYIKDMKINSLIGISGGKVIKNY